MNIKLTMVINKLLANQFRELRLFSASSLIIVFRLENRQRESLACRVGEQETYPQSRTWKIFN